MAMDKVRKEKLAKICANINKRWKSTDGSPSVNYIGNQEIERLERFSSGSTDLDAILGGGWPIGRICEIYGGESVGKSTLMLHAIAEFQQKYPDKDVAFIDSEFCMEPHYAKNLGVDVDNLIICQPESGELAFDVIDSLIEEGIKLIIVDSVAALTPKAELEKDAGEVTVGSQARLMSVQLRKIISKAKLNNVCVLFTNQIRDKIGVMGWGEKTTTPGGQALKFYASIRVALARLGSEKDGDESVGNRVKATTKKNKTCAPFKSSEFLIMFGEGIDNDAGIFEKAVELKVIAKAGAWFNYGETRIGQGKKAALDFVKNSPDMLKEIAEKVLAKIEEQANKKEAKKAAALDKAIAGEISSKIVANETATEEEIEAQEATDDIEVDDV